ncbi:MAG: hypothetical protein AB7M12_09470 [Hyphomonadaceae bacterium]
MNDADQIPAAYCDARAALNRPWWRVPAIVGGVGVCGGGWYLLIDFCMALAN